MFIFSLILSALTINPETKGTIQIPSIFSDNMVLQQNAEAPFWGIANQNENISVKGSWGKSAETTADDHGHWKAKLETP
ncbi:MAG: glycosyl hydrolase family 2, partial [Ignavibacteria bacterium]